jgi:hypothetical protein
MDRVRPEEIAHRTCVNPLALNTTVPALMPMTEHRAVNGVTGHFQSGSTADVPAAHLLES